MSLGFRGKFFLASMALIILTVGVSATWLESNLRSWLESRTESELQRYTRALGQAISLYSGPWDTEALDPFVKRAAQGSGFRLTLIGDDGTVLGESELAGEALERMDKHDTRPEVQSARLQGEGSARRFSDTLGYTMLYVALAIERGDSRPVIRAAVRLKDAEEITERLRKFLLVSTALWLLVAFLLSGLAAHLMAKALKELVDAARDLAEGRIPARLGKSRQDEFGALATYMDRLASELQGQVERVVGTRDRFAAVLEVIDAAVIALDERRRVTMLNPAAVALLELPSDPLGRPLSELLRVPSLHELLDRAEGVGSEFEEIELGYEVPRQVLARVAPFRASQGSVLVLHDVSRLRHLETVRRDFVANVSHELRTPLSIILANTEMLLDGALEDEVAARKFLESMHRSARRLTALVSDLLDLSRLEGGQYTRPSESVHLAALVSSIFESLSAMASDKGLRLSHTVPEDFTLEADPTALEQVVFNLVENAFKYSEQGGEVSVNVEQGVERTRVEVVDDGPGVPESHRSRLFERFYRVDPGRSRDQGGTGLGLAIVKHLVTSMGGSVGMTSSESGGALFWFELPSEPSR